MTGKKGFTLIELAITVVICGFIILIMTCQFVVELNSYNIISDQACTTTEASLVMHSMERVLRYAKSSGTVTITDNATYHKGITATIAGGYLDEIPADTTVVFGLSTNTTNFQYKVGNGTPSTISQYITYFNPSQDPTTKDVTLQVTATKNTRNSSIESKVHLMGG